MRKTLLLFTVLLFGLQGWATTFTVDGVTYTITDATNKTVAIGTGTSTAAISKSTAGAFTIPSSVSYNGDNYAVTAIGDYAFFGCGAITSISIPTTITSIGHESFYACIGLKSIQIPNTVTTISGMAFYFSGLASVSIPSSVTSIGSGAFRVTPGLITVDNNNLNYSSRDGVLYNKTQTILMQCPTSVAQLTIPNTVTSLDYSSFQGCGNLTSIIIPNTVTSIGGGAFINCTNLITINIPSSVTSINDNTFSGCSKLSSITVDSNNQNYSSLDGVLFNKVQTILWEYPGGKKDKSYTIPNSVTSIRTFAFEQTSLKEIIIPSSVKSIGRCTFTNTGLTSIYISTLPLNVNLGDNVFGSVNVSKCNLYVPANSKASFAAADQWKDFVNIFEGDFKPSLSIRTPTTSTYPGGYLTFTATPTYGGTDPAYQWYLNDVAISGATKSTYTSSTLTNNDVITCILTSSLPCATTPTATSNAITMTVSNSFSSGGIYYKITSLTTPYTVAVTNVGSNSYSGNIIIPSSVTYGGTTFSVASITDYAFLASKRLVSVAIPSSVTSIGKTVFQACSGLTSIIVDAANPNYYSDNVVLYNKQVTTLIECAEGKSGAYTIPSSVTSISESGFRNCAGLTSVTFPSSLTSIGDYAFLGCDGITSVVLPSSVTSIGAGAFASCMGITSIHVKNMNPSAIVLGGSGVFYNIITSACSLYVPTGSKSLYAAAEQWSGFNIVEEDGLYAVYATASTGGTVTGSGSYNSGSSCTLTATAATGYTFTGWIENGTVVSTNSSYTFTVNATHTFVANFTANNYAVTVSTSSNTSGTVTNSGTYTYGASCTLTATPAAGYAFTNWTENGTIVSTSANYTFTVNAARTIVANFDRAYSITVSANSTEGGTVTGGGTFLSGTKQTITATANPYYGFKNWTDKKGNAISTSSPFTFTLSKDTTLRANFVKKYDFTDANGLYYKISSPTTAYVTYRNSAGGDYSGNITIPSTATINGISYNVTAIGDSAFYNCSGLTSISIANSVTSIGRYSFFNCSSLPSITLSDAITSVGTYAFASCSNLASVTLPGHLTSLSAYLFSSCSKLTAITIPNSVTAIGSSTFISCSGLTTPTIPASVVSIGIDAFEYCTGLTSITVDSNNPNYCSVDGVLFSKNKTSLIQYPLGNTQTSYSVPNTVTTIGQDAFEKGTKLTSVSIPASVTSINSWAFYGCTGLTSIYANNIDPGKITLGGYVFSSVPTSTCTIYVPTGSKSLYTAASPWKDFSIVEQENIYSIFANSGVAAVGKVAGSGAYASGTSCILTATPATGYTFTGWTENGAIVSTDLSYTFPVSGTRTLVANFNAHITAAANTSDYGSVAGVGNYVVGSSCTLTATPTTGYVFSNWTENGNVVSSSATYTFTVSATRTLVANFATPCILSLSVNSVEGGKVTGAGPYGKGSSQTVTATPNDGYGFKNWINNKGSMLSTSQSYSFTLTKDTTLTANFVKKYDFTDTNGLYYKISSPTTVYVTYRNSAGGDYSGAITIPSTATFNGTSYNVTAIGDSAFYYCSGLTSISIANSVTAIGRYSFFDCGGLTSISFPNAITSIGMNAFSLCNNLSSVSLPSSLTSLSDYLFYDCTKLTAITIPASVVTLGFEVFDICTGLTSITVENNNPNYCSVGGVLFNKNKTTLIQYPLGNTQTSYSIPNTVNTIGESAFAYGPKLTSISIPASVTSIMSYAFYSWDGLTSIYANNIDPGKITLGYAAFYGLETSTCTLYVPTGSKTLYAAADKWKDFTNIVELPLYNITASVNTSTGGNISGAGSFLSGNQCTISALPNTGYSFANWTENGTVVSTDASYTFTVTANRTLVANFTENNAGDYIIAISSNPSAGGSATGTGRYASGATCIVSATANANYMFSNWTENGTVVSNDVTYTFTVSTARTLVANFIAGNTITAISNYSTRGRITGAGGYVTGASCTLTATANTGYIFSNWTENGTVASTKATYTFTVNAAHAFIANFIAGFTINATGDATQGSITGAGAYATGSNCTLKATPKSGYVFTGWSENGTVVSTNPSYTFTVSAARSLVANFSTVTVAVTQPTASTLSGSIVVTPSTGFTYSLDGKTYQSSNEFPYVSIGTYNVTLKNISDGTVSSPVLAVVNASGLVAANNYQIKASNCTCRDTKDGAIAVTLAKALDYTVTVTGINTGTKQSVMFSGTSYNLKNLPADTYKLVFKIDFLDNYEQSFNVVVTQPADLSVLKVGAEKSRATYALTGATNYYVSVNDITTETQGDNVEVSLVPGENRIKIYTEKLCQGVYEETIYNSENGQISLFPNPTTGKITIGIPGEEESVTAEIVSLSGALQLKQKLVVPSSRLVDLDVSYFSSGTYIVKINGSTVHSTVKMMKK